MNDPVRPVDPFAKLTAIGTDQKLFAQHSPSPAATGATPAVFPTPPPTSKATSTPTPVRDKSRAVSRNLARDLTRANSRGQTRDDTRPLSRDLPTRNEIQEFSFRLRDELRVKVQAEVPPAWQDDLENIARDLDVKKLELYRFILGEFLGKVKRRPSV